MDCPSNLDRLTIKGLRCTAHIGCKEEERTLPQALAVNLRLFLDTDCAARTDDLEKTVNYARLSKAVIRHCEESKCMHRNPRPESRHSLPGVLQSDPGGGGGGGQTRRTSKRRIRVCHNP